MGQIWRDKAGDPLNEEYPTEMLPDETTKGYCFLEFEDEETALKAQENLNNHRFDKKHIFKANLFTGKKSLKNVKILKIREK